MGPQDDARQVFEMEVKSTHPRPLQRQCMEAHMIQGFKGNTILNRKGEWGQNLPPKLSIADEDLDKPEHPKRKRNVRQHQPLLQQDHVHEGEEEGQQHPQQQPAESQRPTKRRKTAEDSKSSHMKGMDILRYLKGRAETARLVGQNLDAPSNREEQLTPDIVDDREKMTPQPCLVQVKIDFQALKDEQGNSGLVGIIGN